MRLQSINDLKKNFHGFNIGLSDHTKNNYSSFGAIALGANIIEKHFVDKKLEKDQIFKHQLMKRNYQIL